MFVIVLAWRVSDSLVTYELESGAYLQGDEP